MAVETVLIIDDSKLTCAFVESALAESGHGVKLAHTGAEGIKAFKDCAPDLVLLDVVMPDMNGFDVCKQIRSLPQGVDVPIVFLTGLEDIKTHRTALESGGDDLLTKPINRTELMLRVNSMIWIRRLRTDLRNGYNLIRSQRDALTRSQQQKDSLTNMIVHDLKSPLSSILGFSEILSEHSDPRVKQYAEFVKESAYRINGMVSNMLDITRSEDGKLVPKLKPASLRGILDEVKVAIARRSTMGKVTIEFHAPEDDSPFNLDADLVSRVIENLLDNGLRYSQSGQTISVDVRRSEQGLNIRVSDLGPGIPRDLRDRIFDKFAQIETAERGQIRGAYGLGLTFCRIAVEAHRGRIWVEDNTPSGAVFCVALPTDCELQQEIAAGPSDAAGRA